MATLTGITIKELHETDGIFIFAKLVATGTNLIAPTEMEGEKL
jgi:hypothetical protein